MLTTIEIHGIPHLIAREVGAALGYEQDGRRFVQMIIDHWADELEEGVDFVRLDGTALALLKSMQAGDKAPERCLVEPRARHLILLTQSGYNLALVKAGGEEARRLRRWLATEVMVSLQTTGSYSLSGRSVPVPAESELLVLSAQVRAMQATLDRLASVVPAVLPMGDRFSMEDALSLTFARWYVWRANVPVTADELIAWAFEQADVRNALERVVGRPTRTPGLSPAALQRWLTNALGMHVQTRLDDGRLVDVELRMSRTGRYWLSLSTPRPFDSASPDR